MLQDRMRNELHAGLRLVVQKAERERVARERLDQMRVLAQKDEGELYAEKLVRVSEARLQHAGSELDMAIDALITSLAEMVAGMTEEVARG